MARQTASVVDAICLRIDSGDLCPGDVVDETALGRTLGLSRTPIREALIRLEAQGVIQRRPRKGAVIFQPDLQSYLSVRDVQQRLESQAAHDAARRLTPTVAQALTDIIDTCDQFQRADQAQADAYHAVDQDFHRLIAHASGNSCLAELIVTQTRRLTAYDRALFGMDGVIAASASEHRAIAAAILDRDANGAESLMASHLQGDRMTAMDLIVMFQTA